VASRPKVWVCGSSLLGLQVRIPPGIRMLVSWEWCVLSGRGLYVGLITRPEESYRAWCVQLVWSRSPLRLGHDPESGRSFMGGGGRSSRADQRNIVFFRNLAFKVISACLHEATKLKEINQLCVFSFQLKSYIKSQNNYKAHTVRIILSNATH